VFRPGKRSNISQTYNYQNVTMKFRFIQRKRLYLDVLCIDVSVGVQQQADDGGVAGQHGPVQRRVLVVFVAQVDRDVKREEQPGGIHAVTQEEGVK